MRELDVARVQITDEYWLPRLQTNAQQALLHQWDMLEACGCLDNFRLVSGQMEGIRRGWFFADSDAYKWIDAVCRTFANQPSDALSTRETLRTVRTLRARVASLIALLAAAQEEDGYLYTYNQFHFPGQRWRNLQIEHELYCLGHLIEAAVAHHQATGERGLLEIACKAADLLVQVFMSSVPEGTPGHQEVELALIKLHRTTGAVAYLDLAEHFLEQRGRIKRFAAQIFGSTMSVNRRAAAVDRRRARYYRQHPLRAGAYHPPENASKKPWDITARFYRGVLSGEHFQQHAPIRKQTTPVGHAVRFAYQQTAVAMLYRERGDESLLPALQQAWENMVERRMYVTGGIGSLPVREGFGRDFELDPEIAYAETCAALGCMFWNWEMAQITREAKYADLFEWQLYNASAVGMGLDGRSYLYNNPLVCRDGVTRQPWYAIPCCPPNLSRTWADLGRYLYSWEEDQLWVHQYISSRTEVDLGAPVRLEMTSGLPWVGEIDLKLGLKAPTPLVIYLRRPSWAMSCQVRVNGEPVEVGTLSRPGAREGSGDPSASGYDPRLAAYMPLARTWEPGDRINLTLPMQVVVRQPHPKVKGVQGKVALTRGPLVYCLESLDNPGVDLFHAKVDLATVQAAPCHVPFEGAWVLRGRAQDGVELTAIPYSHWANRGQSHMTVMLQEGQR